MTWLIDTNVLSASLDPGRHPKVQDWLAGHAEDSVLSVITIGELTRGLVRISTRDGRFAARLQRWQQQLEADWADRIIPISVEIARCWGDLSARLGRNDPDLLIAATAQIYGLTVATRNIRHFEGTGVALCNPWDD